MRLRVLGGFLHGEFKDLPKGMRKLDIPILKRLRERQLSLTSDEKTIPAMSTYDIYTYEPRVIRFPSIDRDVRVLAPANSTQYQIDEWLIQLIQGD